MSGTGLKRHNAKTSSEIMDLLAAQEDLSSSEASPKTPVVPFETKQEARIRAATMLARGGKRARQEEAMKELDHALEENLEWVRALKNTRSTILTELGALGMQLSMVETTSREVEAAYKRLKNEDVQ